MFERAFTFMDVPKRSKPRQSGLTMLVDLFIPLGQQRDFLTVYAPFVDIAKIAVGISGILPRQALEAKIATYKEFGVEPFMGGQFLEYGIVRHGMGIARKYFEEAARVGYQLIEVSDNVLDISKEDKQALIRMAVEEYGLKTIGEVGAKEKASSPLDLAKGVHDCIEAGAWKVFVEGAEFISKKDGSMLPEVVKIISENAPVNNILFELPGPWISNVHTCGIYDIITFLIDEFGPEVNLANVTPDSLWHAETLRADVGVKLRVK
jgi:phosphosulfolactate synthase